MKKKGAKIKEILIKYEFAVNWKLIICVISVYSLNICFVYDRFKFFMTVIFFMCIISLKHFCVFTMFYVPVLYLKHSQTDREVGHGFRGVSLLCKYSSSNKYVFFILMIEVGTKFIFWSYYKVLDFFS